MKGLRIFYGAKGDSIDVKRLKIQIRILSFQREILSIEESSGKSYHVNVFVHNSVRLFLYFPERAMAHCGSNEVLIVGGVGCKQFFCFFCLILFGKSVNCSMEILILLSVRM